MSQAKMNKLTILLSNTIFSKAVDGIASLYSAFTALNGLINIQNSLLIVLSSSLSSGK